MPDKLFSKQGVKQGMLGAGNWPLRESRTHMCLDEAAVASLGTHRAPVGRSQALHLRGGPGVGRAALCHGLRGAGHPALVAFSRMLHSS